MVDLDILSHLVGTHLLLWVFLFCLQYKCHVRNITWKYNLHWSNYLFTYFPYFSEFNPPNSTKIVFLGQSFIFRCNVTLSVWPFETASQANTLRQTQTLWNRQTCRHFEMNKHWSRQTGPHGAVVSALGYGSGGPGFKSHQRRGNFLTLDRLQVQPRVSDCGLNGKTETTQSSFIRIMDAILRVLL